MATCIQPLIIQMGHGLLKIMMIGQEWILPISKIHGINHL